MEKHPKRVDFGFEKVDASKKADLVADVFKRVAGRYDLMNDLMSGGLHRIWKAKFVDSLPFRGEAHYLDVAGGTGDIANAILQGLRKRGLRSEVTICDINPAMLSEGKKKLNHLPLKWSCGNAEDLPFPDKSMEVYTIAFGLRNVTHIQKALAEAHRVLKPGGTFACLEFSEVTPLLKKPYDLYSFKLLPLMGKVVANDEAAYRYLVESIRKFPNQEKLCEMLEEAGFPNPSYENYTGGVVSVHKAVKL